MIYPSLLPLNFSELRQVGKNYRVILITIFFNFLVSPILAYYLGLWFLSDYPVLKLGLILISILPGGGMVTSWALKTKAHMGAIIGIVLANLLVAVFVSPFVLSLTLNKVRDELVTSSPAANTCVVEKVSNGAASCLFGDAGLISPLKIAFPIVVIIVFPLVLAYFTRQLIEKKKGGEYLLKKRDLFKNISNAGMLIVIFVLMSLRANAIIFEDWRLLIEAIIPLLIYYLVLSSLAVIAFKYNPTDIGRAFSWGIYLRYITLALGLATSLIYQDESLSVMVVIIMLSYFIQIPLSFLLARYMNAKNLNN